MRCFLLLRVVSRYLNFYILSKDLLVTFLSCSGLSCPHLLHVHPAPLLPPQCSVPQVGRLLYGVSNWVDHRCGRPNPGQPAHSWWSLIFCALYRTHTFSTVFPGAHRLNLSPASWVHSVHYSLPHAYLPCLITPFHILRLKICINFSTSPCMLHVLILSP